MHKLLLTTAMLSVSSLSFAGVGFGYGQMNIDSKAAIEQGIEDTASIFSIYYDKNKQKTAYSLGLNIYLFDDNKTFTNNTTGGVKSSSASGGAFFGDYGFNFQASKSIDFTLKGGFEFILDANRSISNCTGCDSESIDLDGGVYAQAAVRIKLSDSLGLKLRYNQYFSGDNNNGAFIDLVYGF